MGEKPIVNVANALNDGFDPKYISFIDGTCYLADSLDEVYGDYVLLPSMEEVSTDKRKYAEAFKIQYDEQDPYRGKMLVQQHGVKYLVQNRPEKPLNREELDAVYALPYAKTYHPIYESMGGIPAINEVKFSIVNNRGCFGSCSFCAITFHQGRAVQSRSHESILEEAKEITHLPDFKGYIHDVGGPTANFRGPACNKQVTKGACKNRQCLDPSPCKNLKVDHTDYIAEEVLHYMQKPAGETYEKFRQKYFDINRQLGMNQYLIPYLMSSHPGSTLNSAIELAEYLRDIHYQPEQVQDFYPTPGTLSTAMFYTGLDPRDMKPVYVPKSREEKAMQRALLQFSQPRNYDLVHKALVEAGREDLIGFGPRCLIKPRGEFRDFGNSKGGNKGSKNGKGKKEANGNKGNSRDSRNSNNRKSSSRGNDTRNSGRNNGGKNSGRGKSSGKNSKRRPR